MKKLFKLVGTVVMVGLLGMSCATPEPLKIEVDAQKHSIWKSKKIDACQVTVQRSFEYKGEMNGSDNRGNRQYYVWSKDNGNEFLYIVEWRSKNNWSFPKGADRLAPRGDTKGLLEHKANEYAIWDGINKRSYSILLKLGVDVPKNKVVLVESPCINKYRNRAIWIIYGKAWDENHTDFIKILDDYKDVVK